MLYTTKVGECGLESFNVLAAGGDPGRLKAVQYVRLLVSNQHRRCYR